MGLAVELVGNGVVVGITEQDVVLSATWQPPAVELDVQ